MAGVRVIGDGGEDATVACFLLGELTSQRFGAGTRRALVAAGECERLLTDADLADLAAQPERAAAEQARWPGRSVTAGGLVCWGLSNVTRNRLQGSKFVAEHGVSGRTAGNCFDAC